MCGGGPHPPLSHMDGAAGHQYTVYYAARNVANKQLSIGAAVSVSGTPQGPYTDVGAPLVTSSTMGFIGGLAWQRRCGCQCHCFLVCTWGRPELFPRWRHRQVVLGLEVRRKRHREAHANSPCGCHSQRHQGGRWVCVTRPACAERLCAPLFTACCTCTGRPVDDTDFEHASVGRAFGGGAVAGCEEQHVLPVLFRKQRTKLRRRGALSLATTRNGACAVLTYLRGRLQQRRASLGHTRNWALPSCMRPQLRALGSAVQCRAVPCMTTHSLIATLAKPQSPAVSGARPLLSPRPRRWAVGHVVSRVSWV